MNKKKQHQRIALQSFTIVELVTVMILSGIVISMSYLAYGIVNRQLNNYRKSSAQSTMLSQFSRVIKSDFSKAEKVIKTSSGIECQQLQQTVDYNIQYDYIARTTAIPYHSDTFYIETIAAQFLTFDDENAYTDEELAQVLFTIDWKDKELTIIAETNQ